MVKVKPHRTRSDSQPIGNLEVRPAVGQVRQNFRLSVGQARFVPDGVGNRGRTNNKVGRGGRIHPNHGSANISAFPIKFYWRVVGVTGQS